MPSIPFDDLLEKQHPYGPPDNQSSYAAIIDPVSCPAVFDIIPDRTEPYAMLGGQKPPQGSERVVPYIFSFTPQKDDLVFSLICKTVGREHGIVIRFGGNESADFFQIVSHCNKIPYVKMPDGRLVYLRYYDPHILRNYLEIAAPEQLYAIFGDNILEIFAEDGETSTIKKLQRPALQRTPGIPVLQPDQVEYLLKAQYEKFVWILYTEIMKTFYPDIPEDLSDKHKNDVYSLVDLGEKYGILSRGGLYKFVSLCAENSRLHQHSFIEELLKEAVGPETQKLMYFSKKLHPKNPYVNT